MDFPKRYKNIYDDNIILMHKGELNFDLVSVLVSSLEERLTKIEENKIVRKKFYNLATEIIQNLYYHLDEVQVDGSNISEYEAKAALILISARKRFFSFQTGNYLAKSKITKLKEKLEGINAMDAQELRALYKKVLADNEFSDKGTAGLGFIDIARKSGQKFLFDFHEINKDTSYFTFEIKLPRLND